MPSKGSSPSRSTPPNLVDQFGRSTADRLAHLRELERRAPRDVREAIEACERRGTVINYEAGVTWMDD